MFLFFFFMLICCCNTVAPTSFASCRKSLQIQRQPICVIADCKIVNWTYILTEQAKQTQEDFVSIILRYSDACLEEKRRMTTDNPDFANILLFRNH